MYSLRDIAQKFQLKYDGNNIEIRNLKTVKDAKVGDLAIILKEDDINDIEKSEASAFIVPIRLGLPEKIYLKSYEGVKSLLPKLLPFFKNKIKFPEKKIEKNAVLGKNTSVAIGAYIGYECRIDNNTIIYNNVVIMQGTFIGKNCIIYPNVTIYPNTVIGDNVIIHSGAVIGGDAFKFYESLGERKKLEAIGRVVIKDDVEIGCNTTIDRGVVGDTIIEEKSKIDNLVQIGHDVKIGKNSRISSQTGISGESTIGDNVIIYGQVGIRDGIEIAKNSILLAQSGISKDIVKSESYFGSPATEVKKYFKREAILNKFVKEQLDVKQNRRD